VINGDERHCVVTDVRSAAALARSDGAPDHRRRRLLTILSGVGVLVWAVYRSFPDTVPHLPTFERVSWGWPGLHVREKTAYLLSEPLGPISYRLIGYRSVHVYVAVHAVALVLAAGLLYLWFVRALGYERATIAACVVLLAPITAVELSWLGIYDTFSLLTWVLLLFAMRGRPALQFAAAVAAGFQDFEQIVVALTLLWLVLPAFRRSPVRPTFAALFAGCAVGKVVVAAWLVAAHASSGSRWSWLTNATKMSHMLGADGALAPYILWSGVAGLIGFLVQALRHSWPGWGSRLRLRVGGAAVLWIVVQAVTDDHTRVLALTAFPVLVLGAVTVAERTTFVALWRQPAWWLLVLTPPMVVWGHRLVVVGLA
jgi:hypothetical protein